MTEDTKRRQEAVEELRGQLSDLLEGVDFEGEPRFVELNNVHLFDSYAPWAHYDPSYLPFLQYPHHSARGLKTYVISGKRGGRDVTLATISFSARYTGEGEEENKGESISECILQIDQSREQARTAQAEIDQLRIETRELISKLLAA
jgi:hypothetical protein